MKAANRLQYSEGQVGGMINRLDMALPILHQSWTGTMQLVGNDYAHIEPKTFAAVRLQADSRLVQLVFGNVRKQHTPAEAYRSTLTPRARFLITAAKMGDLIVTSQLPHETALTDVEIPRTVALDSYGLSVDMDNAAATLDGPSVIGEHLAHVQATGLEAGITEPRDALRLAIMLHWLPTSRELQY